MVLYFHIVLALLFGTIVLAAFIWGELKFALRELKNEKVMVLLLRRDLYQMAQVNPASDKAGWSKTNQCGWMKIPTQEDIDRIDKQIKELDA